MFTKLVRLAAVLSLVLFQAAVHAAKLPGHETVKVADGVYAFISAESNNAIVSGNSVAVIGDDGVLVVDSGNFPSETRKIIAEIRQLTPLPVRYLVHTHWHRDHTDGDSEYRAAFPNVVIISTPYTRKMVTDRAMKNLDEEIKMGPEYASYLRKLAQDGKDGSGKVLSAEEKTYDSDFAESIDAAVAEFKQVKLLLSDETFDQNLDVHLGKREVQLKFLGRGNTGGDAVIYVPDAKVVMAGDLLVYPTPYAFDSYFSDWIQTLGKLKAIGAATIVPGHGPVQHNNDYIDLVSSLLQSFNSQVQQAVRQNLSLDETRKKVDVASFEKQFAGDNPNRRRNFEAYFLGMAVERAYKEAKGTPDTP
jgi:glyoxylase-like metal-dependent hydrolase (beta-lactamase superfamily II)